MAGSFGADEGADGRSSGDAFASRARIVRGVDDDAAGCVALVRLLKSAGHAAMAFEAAMSFLPENDYSAPGCIILDVGLPDLDGLALQEMLARRGSTTPVIFLTGHADSKTRARAMEGGAV